MTQKKSLIVVSRYKKYSIGHNLFIMFGVFKRPLLIVPVSIYCYSFKGKISWEVDGIKCFALVINAVVKLANG